MYQSKARSEGLNRTGVTYQELGNAPCVLMTGNAHIHWSLQGYFRATSMLAGWHRSPVPMQWLFSTLQPALRRWTHLRELSSTKGFRLRRRASFACSKSSRTSCGTKNHESVAHCEIRCLPQGIAEGNRTQECFRKPTTRYSGQHAALPSSVSTAYAVRTNVTSPFPCSLHSCTAAA